MIPPFRDELATCIGCGTRLWDDRGKVQTWCALCPPTPAAGGQWRIEEAMSPHHQIPQGARWWRRLPQSVESLIYYRSPDYDRIDPKLVRLSIKDATGLEWPLRSGEIIQVRALIEITWPARDYTRCISSTHIVVDVLSVAQPSPPTLWRPLTAPGVHSHPDVERGLHRDNADARWFPLPLPNPRPSWLR